jgi:hypothetical protein
MRPTTKKRLSALLKVGKPTPGRWPRRDPHQPGLFGDQAVTADDVRRWLLKVPRMDPDSPRAARYVIAYDVHGKIARAKAAGQFERILDGRQDRDLAVLPFK